MNSLSTSASSGRLAVRDASSTTMSPTMLDLLIVLIVLLFVSLLLVGALYAVRKIRQRRAITRQQLPSYNEKVLIPSNHKRLKIQSPGLYVYDEKRSMISPPSSPGSPGSVPEIRITFPDEEDKHGRRRSGRVVVVHVSETGVGLEPLEEQLPAYEKESSERFHSIDLERIGGLKEKSQWS